MWLVMFRMSGIYGDGRLFLILYSMVRLIIVLLCVTLLVLSLLWYLCVTYLATHLSTISIMCFAMHLICTRLNRMLNH